MQPFVTVVIDGAVAVFVAVDGVTSNWVVPSRPEYSTTAIAAFGVDGLLTHVWVLLSLAATLVSSRAAIVAELAFIATSKEFVHPLGGVVVAVVPFPRATHP